jgi:hypothetical protein
MINKKIIEYEIEKNIILFFQIKQISIKRLETQSDG